MIEIKNLTKQYTNTEGRTTAIQDVSLSVNKWEIVCIVGPSGSWKSTLLKCLTGLDTDYQGSININRKSSEDYLEHSRIALVSQKYSNFPRLTVFENIAIGFHGRNMLPGEVTKATTKLLKRVGLFKARNQFTSKLSGGMQQRVAIARALAQQTEIIVFDEPFGALDVQTRSQMQEFLAKLWEDEKKTMIFVTHDIEEAIFLSNRIFVLGTSPGTIKETVEVNIPRPRRSEIRFQDTFIKLKKHISYTIRSESIIARLDSWIIDSEKDTLKMGLSIWAGNALLYYAKDSWLLSSESFDVEQIGFDDNKEKLKLWTTWKLDLINVSLDKAIELSATMPDLRIVDILNRSNWGHGIIASDDLTKIKDLKWKTIWLEKGTSAEFFLLYVLDRNWMSSKDVFIKDMKCWKIWSELIAGTIDSGVLREPWLDKAVELSHMQVLTSTKDYPVIYDVLIAKNNLCDQKMTELIRLSRLKKNVVAMLPKEEEEIISVVSSHIWIPERELMDYLNKIDFVEHDKAKVVKIMKEIEKVLIKENTITLMMDLEKVIIEITPES